MMDEDRLIELAAQIGLGRAMKPIGMQTGDVFATEQGYRTGELLAFAAAVTAAERERCAKLCEGMHDEDRPSDYAWTIRTEWAADVCGPNVRGNLEPTQ